MSETEKTALSMPQAALAFLRRAQIHGSEAEAYLRVVRWLEELGVGDSRAENVLARLREVYADNHDVVTVLDRIERTAG
jgi:hypothetical protein